MSVRNTLTIVVVGLALSLSACGEGAQNAANQAKDSTQQASKEIARAELCGYVEDNKVSPNEAIALRASADVAQAAGVDQALVDAARTVANASDGKAANNDIERFAAECQK